MGKQKIWFLAIVLMVALILAACSSDSQDARDNGDQSKEKTEDVKTDLQVMENEKVGKYLADSKGMTLYIFTKDEKSVSNCKGKCLKNWPAFYAKDFEVPEGYDKDDFGTITREDTDKKQLTYKGYPLYYFVKDKAKGDVKGQGVKDVWYVVNNQTFKKHINESQTGLTKGIDKVLTSLQDLKSTTTSSPNDAKKINKRGKDLSESWEPIEEKIEERNAQAYENIEESLYPLIAEAQKDQPDVDKVKKLVDETVDKLKQFKQKMAQATSTKGTAHQHMVYVNDRDANAVQVIDPKNNKIIETIQVEKKTTYNEVSPNGKYDYVVNSGSENVSIINTQTDQVVKTIPVGKTPKGVNFTPNGKWAYVINEGEGTVTVIDTQAMKPMGKIEVGKFPHNGVSSPDSSKFYVTNTGSNSVSVIDTSTQKVINTIEGVNGAPHNINITPDGNTLLVSLTEKTLSV